MYKFIQNLRWRAFWFLNKCDNSDNIVDTDNSGNIADANNSNSLFDTVNNYSCFPTKQSAPECEYLKHFEHDLYLLVKSIEFRKCLSPIQKKMINKFKHLIISSDKTNVLYIITKN